MRFDRARAVADAVLFEGYVLYPYRATAPKNRYRWTFGVLAPRAWSEAGGCEASWLEAVVLLERPARIEGRLRFLHARRRTVEVPADGGWRPVERLEAGGVVHLPWEEGEVREVDFGAGDALVPFAFPGGVEVEEVPGGRIVRRALDVRGTVRVSAEADGEHVRVRVRVDNETPWDRPDAPREEVLGAACIGAHVLLAAVDGAFVSLLDPPPGAEDAVARSASTRCWPVLAGPPGERDLVLAAPIVLYDHPQVAPESAGDFFDATEIDELLALRTVALTPEEKGQVRATDPRAAAILDRVEGFDLARMEGLHGARRDLSEAEMVPRSRVVHDDAAAAEAGYPRGAKVRLRPGPRRTDAQDLLHAGLVATVEAVLRDLDGEPHLAVTIDVDPAADLNRWYGRFHYYRTDEVEPA